MPDLPSSAPSWRVLDLFTGGFGLGLGFAQCGCVVVGVDNHEGVLAHARRNLVGTPHTLLCQDLLHPDARPPDGVFDVQIGGPSCLAFSQAARKRTQPRLYEKDPRNGVTVFLRMAVEHVRPKVLVMEQSPELLKRTEYWEGVCLRTLVDGGYETAHSVVRMEYWGVPEKRRRLILVAVRADVARDGWRDGLFDEQGQRESVVADVLADVSPSPHPLHPLPTHVLARIDRYERALRHARVVDRARPCRTLTIQNLDHATNDALRFAFDPDDNATLVDRVPLSETKNVDLTQRLLTIREAARIHTFPETWLWDVDLDPSASRATDARVIGNSVPPEFARRLCRRLQERM